MEVPCWHEGRTAGSRASYYRGELPVAVAGRRSSGNQRSRERRVGASNSASGSFRKHPVAVRISAERCSTSIPGGSACRPFNMPNHTKYGPSVRTGRRNLANPRLWILGRLSAFARATAERGATTAAARFHDSCAPGALSKVVRALALLWPTVSSLPPKA